MKSQSYLQLPHHWNCFRFIMAICVSNQHPEDPHYILSSDVERAYFFVKAKKAISIEIAAQGSGRQMGRFNSSFHGARDVATNWQDEFIEIMRRNEFNKGRTSLCNFHHITRSINVIVHGDDFISIGT